MSNDHPGMFRLLICPNLPAHGPHEMITRRCKIVSRWWINPDYTDRTRATQDQSYFCSCLKLMAFVLMMLWPMSVPPPPGLGIACAGWGGDTEILRSSQKTQRLPYKEGGRGTIRHPLSRSKSCLRKHKTVIHRFCSKHPSRRFQSRAINKMGKPKTGKECREEEERVVGRVTTNKAMNIYNYVWFTNVRWGWKKWGCHPSQKLGNKSQSENKLQHGFIRDQPGQKVRGTGPPISGQRGLLILITVNIMAL